MSGEKMTPEEFANRVAWEGGVVEALDYGLKETDLADDGDPGLQTAWAVLREEYARIEPKIRAVELMLEAWQE